MNGENKSYAGKSQDQESLKRVRCKWNDNIKMNLRQTGQAGRSEKVKWQASENAFEFCKGNFLSR